MRKCFYLVLAAAVLVSTPKGQAEVDPKNFDTSVKPQDDFYQYAVGGWRQANPIPADYSGWGVFNEISERNNTALHTILERVSKAPSPAFIDKLVGDFYASGMDEAAIESAGLTPVQPELDRIAALSDMTQLPKVLGRLRALGIWAGFGFSSEADPSNSSMTIAAAEQSGLGLPERDYYLRTDDQSKKVREQYVAHVAKVFELAGDDSTTANAEAAAVMKLETALAQGSRTRAALRDPIANFHKMPPADLQKLTPHFLWADYFAALGLAAPDTIDVGQPEFFTAFDAQIPATSLTDWKAYLRWQFLTSISGTLSTPFVNEDFAFYGKTLGGALKLRERWKRVLGLVNGFCGEAIGQLYVAECFPPAAKTRALELVGNLRAVFRERLQTLEWMDEATRAAAVKKLDALNVKIGYPDKWRDYSKLVIDRGPFVLNFLRAREFYTGFQLNKIGKPVDRAEWDPSPQTVNAYYNPDLNEIVFPAGILQPPFFDATADDPVNYGAIGAIIGHEMTHGFDDQGRQYDAVGNLHDWWSPASTKNFKERSARIVKQFSDYTVLDGLHINGEVTQGENIADLGGVKIAYSALEKALTGQERKSVDGFTPEQRFFLSFATNWRENHRPEGLRQQVLTDPHSPARFRVIGPLSNLPEFWQAFNVPEGAPMRRAAADQVVIW